MGLLHSFTRVSKIESYSSSSSGLQSICPIYAKFRPSFAPTFRRVHEIRMLRRQTGLKGRHFSSNFISLSMLIDFI